MNLPVTVGIAKRQAKSLRQKHLRLTHAQSLDRLGKSYGFNSWATLKKAIFKQAHELNFKVAMQFGSHLHPNPPMPMYGACDVAWKILILNKYPVDQTIIIPTLDGRFGIYIHGNRNWYFKTCAHSFDGHYPFDEADWFNREILGYQDDEDIRIFFDMPRFE